MVNNEYCTKSGAYGPAWKYGNASDYANIVLFKGVDMFKGCCACGGGQTDTCADGHDYDASIPSIIGSKAQIGARALSKCTDIPSVAREGNMTVATMCDYYDQVVTAAAQGRYGEHALSTACACTCKGGAHCQDCTTGTGDVDLAGLGYASVLRATKGMSAGAGGLNMPEIRTILAANGLATVGTSLEIRARLLGSALLFQ